MDGLIDDVTLEEFKIFYGLDRELYTILVRDLSRNPSESLQVMGFWLWLERGGFSNLISTLLSLDLLLVNKACDEALACLHFVNNPSHSPLPPGMTAGIPLTRRLLKTEVSLLYFQENRLKVFHDVQNLVSDVYIPALSDIMEQARRGAFVKSPVRPKPPPVPAITFDDLIARAFSGLSIEGGCNMGRARCGGEGPPRSARTMFVTFSKGYPVAEAEVREFFTRLFGNCIESLYMQEVEPDEQALYARIVFVKPSYIQFILNGQGKAKFSINGKHVWMRQFVPRSGRTWPCGCPTVGPSACPHQY
ncbi:hypothetical protein PHJA_000091000 [Phtheirospermum japonicum]|uniref:Uncharacterized protein n=1 Tax=Phtheirospermum japonicum TaxID=374723 RepID=A0A830B5Q1_9LAMI|nr:hypothetical protein PHJA_000091000 [Phtheirospermum japonicum]